VGLSKFTAWMKESSSSEKKKLGELSRCSVQHLYDIASGRRNASYGTALRIVLASRSLMSLEREGGDLPYLGLADVYSGELLKKGEL
jgi:hypothetical protein